LTHCRATSEILVLVLILALLTPLPVFANKTMFMQATLNSIPTEQGVSAVISGRVFDTTGTPVSNAIISIQVTNPQATSIHLAVAYTATDGTFQDTFVIASNSPGGNYTAYLVADKPGYDTARVTLSFTYSSPDFFLQSSTAAITVRQGDTEKVTLTVLSMRGFNEAVNLTAINLPSGVAIQFSPPSVTPGGGAVATVAVSETATVGNFTVTLLGISGGLIHRVPIQLVIIPGPFPIAIVLVVAFVVVALFAAVFLQKRRQRSWKKAALEELLKASEADKGYVATARVIARLEELRATNQVDEDTYQRLKKEYEKRLEKSK